MSRNNEIQNILKWFGSRLIIIAAFLFLLNFIYSRYFFDADIKKFSRVKPNIEDAFKNAEIVYLGESSNTSFNPWTDTLSQSISDFIQLYLPDSSIKAITHEGYHPGLFRQMLNLIPVDPSARKVNTIILGVNMRTCGPSAIHSGNEASNQREALFYSHRPPLLSRIFMGLHFYDSKGESERTRMKFQWWRTQPINKESFSNLKYNTAFEWITDLDKLYGDSIPEEIKHMASAYVKEFAFILNDDNERVRDLKSIVDLCNEKNIKLLFHILPPNRFHASMLFSHYEGELMIMDTTLTQIMDYNYEFLKAKFKNWGVPFVDNYRLKSAEGENKGGRFTDQWYPTEHYDAVIRRDIAETIAAELLGVKLGSSEFISRHNKVNHILKQNNFPNWEIQMPLSFDKLHQWSRALTTN